MAACFEDLEVGNRVKLCFPRGGSISGVIIEIDRDFRWALISQPSGARSSVYVYEVEHIEHLS